MAVRVDEAAFTFDYYLPQIVAMIADAWLQPAGISGQGQGPLATIRFRIGRNGAASGTTIEESSAVALFDRSALEAIQSAQPFPPLPPAYAGDWLTVHLRFIYTDPRPAGLYRR
jgi:TonB family protein